jgi:hypothetical protein
MGLHEQLNGMNSEDLKNTINQLISSFEKSGFSTLFSDRVFPFESLESQLNSSLERFLKWENGQHELQLLEDRKFNKHYFYLIAYRDKEANNLYPKLSYLFHCLYEYPNVLVDRIEVQSMGISSFIELYGKREFPTLEEAYKLHLKGIAGKENKSFGECASPSKQYFIVESTDICQEWEFYNHTLMAVHDSIKEAFIHFNELSKWS